MAIFIVIVIGVIIIIYWHLSSKKAEEERVRIEMARKDQQQKCRNKFESMKQQALDVYRKNAHVQWGNAMRSETISQLISMRFYYDENRNISYISLNLDNSGQKALFQNDYSAGRGGCESFG